MNRMKVALLAAVMVCGVMLLVACQSRASTDTDTDNAVVKIAIPYDEDLFNINEQYYKLWLEEQTGLSIEFTFIPQLYEQEFLQLLLSEQGGQIDAVFFSQNVLLTPEEIAAYGEQGKILALESLIEQDGTYLPAIFETHAQYDLREAITAPDGHIYYMPALEVSETSTTFQTMWINTDWLTKAGRVIPTTTQELRETLRAFVALRPDCPPLIGSAERESDFACNFLMNAFSVCDPINSYMAVENGQVYFPPKTDGWREGLRYCHELYEEGLLVSQSFTYSSDQLVSICNDPRSLVGTFCSKRMSDILSRKSSELLNKFVTVSPLSSPLKSGTSIVQVPRPRPGGIILESSQHKQAVLRLMDLMCSEEGFLAGHYGERGADWNWAKIGEVSANGNPAAITITKQTVSQNGARRVVVGPYVTVAKYSDNVAWNGYQLNQSEYLEARVFRAYQRYEQDEYIAAILFSQNKIENEESLAKIRQYTKSSMIDFITGRLDIEDDKTWQAYISGFEDYKLTEMLQTVQHESGATRQNQKEIKQK